MMKPFSLVWCFVLAAVLSISAVESGSQPAAQEALTWLKGVDAQLKKPKLADLTPEQFSSLTEVTLGGHRQSDNKHLDVPAAEFRHLAAMPSLRKLVMWENDGVTNEALAHIGKLTNLRELELGDAPITSEGIKHLQNLSALSYLGLAFTKDVGDSALQTIAALPQLEVLVLSGTKVTDNGLKQLADMKNLREVRLAMMPQITDAGLMNLQDCASLRTVVFNKKKNALTPAGIAAFQRVRPDCQVVMN